MRYFDLSENVSAPGRWDLGKIVDSLGNVLLSGLLTRGEFLHIDGPLNVPVRGAGQPTDFSHAAFGLPVVNQKAASILTELAPKDVQLIPVNVDALCEPHFLLNALRLVDCIDDAASEEVQRWTPEDGRPEKVGMYRAVYGMRIDPTRVGTAKVFRTWGWRVDLIVSEDIKTALERAGVTGAKFKEVTGPSAVSQEERERDQKFRDLSQQAHAARQAFWNTLGQVEDEFTIPPVVGGPWPSRREVWRVIRRPGGHTLLVTDGLSDPFYLRAEPSVGFGMELCLETAEPFGDVAKSWPALLLERASLEIAEHERLRERLRTGTLSMEVAGKSMPEPLLTKDGRVGILLGMRPSTLPQDFPLPAGPVQLLALKALMPAELAYLLEHGKQGVAELVRRFDSEGQGHLSRAWRRSVV